MVRKTKPTDEARAKSAENVQFHCYDIVNKKMKFSTRDSWLAGNLQSNHCIKLVPTNQVFREDDARVYHARNLAAGYEGSIVRLDTAYQCKRSHSLRKFKDFSDAEANIVGYEGSIVRLNTPYQCKRSHSLRKFKDFSDAEANIVGYEEGKGKRTGTLGKFIMQDDDGNQFGCPPGKGHNYKDLAIMLANIHEYMGQRATFTYFERTKAGSYRHPLYKCIRNYE